MTLKKPMKLAVAFYIENKKGEFTAIKRLPDDESLPDVWGLSAASLRGGEDYEQAVKRGASEKLGIKVNKMQFVGEDEIERPKYFLKLREYRILGYENKPNLQGGDKYYAKFAWQKDPEIFRKAAEKGSLCSRIFLRNRGLWDGEEKK